MTHATMPRDKEIFTHLQHTPWIFLPFSFDANACLNEALPLLDRFVVHREGHQKGSAGAQWKSLALRSIGGHAHATSESGDNEAFHLTDVAAACPATMQMLGKLADLDQCARVRFMLLEPGAEISVHSDAPHKNHSLAINIALNMPEGCEFWADLNPDGSKHKYSRRIPIESGSVFLFNSSAYHRVVNHSREPRMHLIVHGPLRLSDEQVLRSAREQNGMSGPGAVRALVEKKLHLGEMIPRTSSLFSDWQYAASVKVLPEQIAVGVFTEWLEDPLLEEQCLKTSRGSLFPLQADPFPLPFLHEWLRQKSEKGAKFAVVLAAGTYVHYAPEFSLEVMRAIVDLENRGLTLAGHLMNRKDRLPYLNEQFLLINLERWKKNQLPAFGEVEKREGGRFPSFRAAEENIHGDYTPLWIERDSSGTGISGVAGFGTEVLASLLEKGERVINISPALRKQKEFSYPRAGRAENYFRVQAIVEQNIEAEEKALFPFNTERLAVPSYGFVPRTILSPCAGLKPFALLRQLCGQSDSSRMVFVERNKFALRHFEKLLSCTDYESVLKILEQALEQSGTTPTDDAQYVSRQMHAILTEAFAGDENEFLRCLSMVAKQSTLLQIDYFRDHAKLAACVEPGESFFFWHSNAWETRSALLRFSPAELRLNYRELAKRFVDRLQIPAWMHKTSFETVFGADAASPSAVFTSGGSRLERHKLSGYELLQ